jgi:hypothetical protein
VAANQLTSHLSERRSLAASAPPNLDAKDSQARAQLGCHLHEPPPHIHCGSVERIILPPLQTADQPSQAPGVLGAESPDPLDPEALHDFRVAIRRLRSCIRAYRTELQGSVSKQMQRRLRKLTLATNAGRDAEVHLNRLRNQVGSPTRRPTRQLCAGTIKPESSLAPALDVCPGLKGSVY